MKLLSVVCLLAFATLTCASCPGCVTQLSGRELEKAAETLKICLVKCAEVNGPVYKLVKLNSATRQLKSGTKTVANATLEDINKNLKTCYIHIWARPWLVDGIEVTYRCRGEKPVFVKHSV